MRAIGVVFAMVAGLAGRGWSFDLNFSVGSISVPDHFLSDGTTPIPTFADYRFELGTFVEQAGGGAFVPDATNTDEWLAHWVPIADSSGTPYAGGNAEYGEFATVFGNVKGFTSTMDFDHANAPFGPGAQMYVWGYDQRDTPGAAQWVLFTNPVKWLLNDGSSEQSFAQNFDPGGATDVAVGSITGETVQLGDVVVPGGAPPALSIADALVSETAGVVVLTVELSAASGSDVSVHYSTVPGSALPGGDYTAASGTLTVPSGQLSGTIAVSIGDDPDAETDEAFQVVLDTPVGATLADADAVVTLLDDDAPGALVEDGGTLERDDSSGVLSVAWPSVAGRDYAVWFSHDLQEWAPLAGAESITADGSTTAFELPTSEVRCFYKVVDLAPPAP